MMLTGSLSIRNANMGAGQASQTNALQCRAPVPGITAAWFPNIFRKTDEGQEATEKAVLKGLSRPVQLHPPQQAPVQAIGSQSCSMM